MEKVRFLLEDMVISREEYDTLKKKCKNNKTKQSWIYFGEIKRQVYLHKKELYSNPVNPKANSYHRLVSGETIKSEEKPTKPIIKPRHFAKHYRLLKDTCYIRNEILKCGIFLKDGENLYEKLDWIREKYPYCVGITHNKKAMKLIPHHKLGDDEMYNSDNNRYIRNGRPVLQYTWSDLYIINNH